VACNVTVLPTVQCILEEKHGVSLWTGFIWIRLALKDTLSWTGMNSFWNHKSEELLFENVAIGFSRKSLHRKVNHEYA